MKRAFRRRKKQAHLKRRARNYYDYSFSTNVNNDNICWADYWNEVQSGESGIWMRHTGKVCSCSICSYNKYERPTAELIRKYIDDQLNDI